VSGERAGRDGSTNFSGEWKLDRNHNYQEFLTMQGANWIERKAADSFAATHIIVDSGEKVKLSIRSLLNLEEDYVIDGPPIETKVNNKSQNDTNPNSEPTS